MIDVQNYEKIKICANDYIHEYKYESLSWPKYRIGDVIFGGHF